MRRKSIVAAAEKAFVNNTSGFFFAKKRSLERQEGETRVFQKGLVCCQIQTKPRIQHKHSRVDEQARKGKKRKHHKISTKPIKSRLDR